MALDEEIVRLHLEGPLGQGLEPMAEITPVMLEDGSASELCHDYYPSIIPAPAPPRRSS